MSFLSWILKKVESKLDVSLIKNENYAEVAIDKSALLPYSILKTEHANSDEALSVHGVKKIL